MKLKTYLKRLYELAVEEDYMTTKEFGTISNEKLLIIGSLRAEICNLIDEIEDLDE